MRNFVSPESFDKSRKTPQTSNADLHCTLCRSRALLIIVDVRANHLGDNLIDCW